MLGSPMPRVIDRRKEPSKFGTSIVESTMAEMGKPNLRIAEDAEEGPVFGPFGSGNGSRREL